jgi:hypothetical protein
MYSYAAQANEEGQAHKSSTHRAGAVQALDPEMSHCSVPMDSGGVSLGSVPITGNRFIAIEGRLKDIIAALSNVTYVPDPYFNTDLPGNEEFIHVSIDDQVANHATSCPNQAV